MSRQPALFLGHGSPMAIIQPSAELRALGELGHSLPRPKAVLCISAHYESQGKTHLTVGASPKTIHDFRGFPPELYEVQYPAPGDDALVNRIAGLLGEDRIHRDSQWGFDHGVYGVLLPLFGHAEIPTVAMSLDRSLSPEQHLATARALAPLRDEGVLIVASGNIIHNLSLWRQSQGTQPDWALDFRARTNAAILAGTDEALHTFSANDQAAASAINSAEHYLPLLYAAGARLPDDDIRLFNDTLDGALSMTSVLYGDAGLLA